MANNDTYVQVQPDSPLGKKLRNVQVTTLGADGTTNTVLMEVVTIADEFGNIWDDTINQQSLQLLQDIRTELRIMNIQLRDGLRGSSDVRKADPIELRDDPDFIND